MTKFSYIILAFPILFSACHTGQLNNLLDLPVSLKENSALEYTNQDRLLWTIEDAGNPNALYALDAKGQLTKTIEIENAENIDWEDLASDQEENIYIGDFGNNEKTREHFTIYKVSKPGKAMKRSSAEKIAFTLPSTMESQDFEAFFLYENKFYIFSKGTKETIMISVENSIGDHVAQLVTTSKLDGKDNQITAADISADGKTIVLLNHEKLWKLSKFKADKFFEGTVEIIPFGHTSQKEGIVFITKDEVLISDELKNNNGGNLYHLELKGKKSAEGTNQNK
ncbi:hypothetical protein ESY86_02925 [Subsaximicrobium wynnwilliamsii]|uniref:Uncharacterized protein n=1 Tax=Subsaximicrobium wynnwilliamsii TaxID=291179 RepID=A0A5C6ZM01_9FLAO|nr:SdiA-regulated domain-containing protein [Subsaximicrobium wynnwilliamsii]TXD85572.1 hypothetical protein ESY87_01235 [Subsaximicrobium wynnwilliamsii]TXD90925.1 hypothetical protein ESY86_02925 [Subsaximicrobium wynnwilliamsii]TXE05432.1 hypothetical protein ESY88_01235 [Subsaximicrobium wynnwilliamsii]